MGWIGNFLIIIGLWRLGYKDRRAFLFSIVGELCWAVNSFLNVQYDLTFICVVFCCLAFKNYLQWGKQ